MLTACTYQIFCNSSDKMKFFHDGQYSGLRGAILTCEDLQGLLPSFHLNGRKKHSLHLMQDSYAEPQLYESKVLTFELIQSWRVDVNDRRIRIVYLHIVTLTKIAKNTRRDDR